LINVIIFKQVINLPSFDLLADFSYVCGAFVLLKPDELFGPPQSLE